MAIIASASADISVVMSQGNAPFDAGTKISDNNILPLGVNPITQISPYLIDGKELVTTHWTMGSGINKSWGWSYVWLTPNQAAKRMIRIS